MRSWARIGIFLKTCASQYYIYALQTGAELPYYEGIKERIYVTMPCPLEPYMKYVFHKQHGNMALENNVNDVIEEGGGGLIICFVQ